MWLLLWVLSAVIPSVIWVGKETGSVTAEDVIICILLSWLGPVIPITYFFHFLWIEARYVVLWSKRKKV